MDDKTQYLQQLLLEKKGGEEGASEAKEYWRKVDKELKLREKKLSSLDQEIRYIKFKLRRLTSRKLVFRGDALRIACAASFKKSLRVKLEEGNKKKAELLRDIAKARERMEIAQEEMDLANG